MSKVFSRCGMRCDLCLIYRPNVEKEDRREAICAVFSKVWPDRAFDPATIICDGCLSDKTDAILQDPECSARACVLEKGIEHCGHCDCYPCHKFPAEPPKEYIFQKVEVEKQWTWEDEKLMEAYTCRKNMDEFRQGR
ncbi:MAG: DUF3795 domain-containing protein [Clostridiales bacterium]|nr:DUF3795 domain-containing protein [Clostridiales bacterium]